MAHVIELSCFSLGDFLLNHVWDYGNLIGPDGQPTRDYWYFSFAVYTSLGFGDVTPSGSLRFMTALEALAGLVLIAWTASSIFLEMQTSWGLTSGSTLDESSADASVSS